MKAQILTGMKLERIMERYQGGSMRALSILRTLHALHGEEVVHQLLDLLDDHTTDEDTYVAATEALRLMSGATR